jgi:hypothetical protein
VRGVIGMSQPREFRADKSNTDDAYRTYLKEKPSLFVVNARKKPSADYLVIHTSKCRLVTMYSSAMKEGAFTQRQYIKICSPSEEELRAWIKKYGADDFSNKQCSCLSVKS